MSRTDAILLDRGDNVATVLRRIEPGETLRVAGPEGGVQLTAAEAIPIFHKIAVKALRSGSDVLKYGESIGALTADAAKGALVHVHNLRSRRARATAAG